MLITCTRVHLYALLYSNKALRERESIFNSNFNVILNKLQFKTALLDISSNSIPNYSIFTFIFKSTYCYMVSHKLFADSQSLTNQVITSQY